MYLQIISKYETAMVKNATNYIFFVAIIHCVGNALISKGERKQFSESSLLSSAFVFHPPEHREDYGRVRGYLRLFLTSLLTLVCIESLTVR